MPRETEGQVPIKAPRLRPSRQRAGRPAFDVDQCRVVPKEITVCVCAPRRFTPGMMVAFFIAMGLLVILAAGCGSARRTDTTGKGE